METIKKAKELLKQGKIEKISESLWQVDGHLVKLHSKPGRSYFTCDCPNFTKFCIEKPVCAHQKAIILFEAQEFGLKKVIREAQELAEQSKALGISIDPDFLINFANDLRRFI